MTTQATAKAYAYARRNPTHEVYVCVGSTEGEYLWRVWGDGERRCCSDSFGGYSRPTRAEFAAFCRKQEIAEGTTVVFFGLRGNPLRAKA